MESKPLDANRLHATPTPNSGAPAERPTEFPHPSEREFACILDFYQIPWQYEPTTFALEWDEAGNVKEAFSPDFYLPDQDIYIELTTLRPGLMNRKHRKLRRLKELYPDVQVKLVDRRDFANLLFKYGLEDEKERLVGQAAIDAAAAAEANTSNSVEAQDDESGPTE
jgi:hypothetical protein